MNVIRLGLDIGGTASRWVACDNSGVVVARGQVAGATGHVFNPAERVRLETALRGVGAGLAERGLVSERVVAGITGFGSGALGEVRALMASALGVAEHDALIADDVLLAYAANFAPGEGFLISAGTGSIGVHVAADGAFVRVGGRGILIDDGGSGSWIALRALDQVYRVFDRDGDFAAVQQLADALFSEIGGAEWGDVRQFVYAGDRGRIGSLAIAVARAAEAGDATALTILRDAGAELARLATAMAVRVGPRPVKLSGGVLKLHPAILDAVKRALPTDAVETAEADAALAAAQMDGAWRQTLAAISARA